MIISEQEKNRIRGLHKKHSIIKEQPYDFQATSLDDCVIHGQEGNRETCVDYVLRRFMHITTKPGSFDEHVYVENIVDDLTDEEKEQYCKLLSDKFLADFDTFMKVDAPFEGDTIC